MRGREERVRSSILALSPLSIPRELEGGTEDEMGRKEGEERETLLPLEAAAEEEVN